MLIRIITSLIFIILIATSINADNWPTYGNIGGTKYSKLDQINPENVHRLEVAWQYSTGELERRSDLANQTSKVQVNPILLPENAGGSLIICTPFSRVIALDPINGKERWIFEPKMRISGYSSEIDPKGTSTPAFSNCRGVAFWQNNSNDTDCKNRIFLATNDLRLIAINALNGRTCGGFGRNGTINLEKEILDGNPPAKIGEVKFPSPPTVVNDVIVLGSSVRDNHRANSPNGSVRAFDAKNGKAIWSFDPIPRNIDNPAYSEWEKSSVEITGGGNVWGLMTADQERDLIFMPTSSPSPDFYGGTRPGNNLYADSIVAIKAKTGEIIWHFQTIHHNVWDYDNAAQPTLVDLEKNGEAFPAVVQATKTGMIYIFHRETGETFFPIEERPVPTNGVIGDKLSSTQPFPLAPPPLVPQIFSPNKIWGITAMDRAACRKKYAGARYGDIFTPPSEEGTVLVPSTAGGVNWGGGGVDTQKNIFVVNVLNMGHFVKLIPRNKISEEEEGSPENTMNQVTPILGTPYALEQGPFVSPNFIPCTPPPWAFLTGVDLQRGKILWKTPLGVMDKMMPLALPLRWGITTFGGPLITNSGLTFIGGTADSRFRAFLTANGKEIWSVEMQSGSFALPMTYKKNGKQYIVIATGPHPFIYPVPSDHITAFALP
ncbi:MAG: pyrroloquinoline quinone-dependent dehydrogenase [Pseudomonadota bacterium]|nr:pyrroloquinoline quinone-dependent dehydrogenase [Pseudomonadota bacterium]